MLHIGIDPGLGGGIAVLDTAGMVRACHRMPATDREVWDLLVRVSRNSPTAVRAVLEFVRSSPQMGVTSAFSFGRGYGGLRMALAGNSIPFEEVTPQKWQAALGCRTKGDKNVSKRKAIELFPDMKVTHNIADALLIAEYGRRLETRA